MKCYVLRDLLPEYLEQLCSEETITEINEHLKGCKACQEYMKSINTDMPGLENGQKDSSAIVDGFDGEIQPFKKIKHKFKKKSRRLTFCVILLILVCGVFGVLTVGQIFPVTNLPNYDRIIINYNAKMVGKNFANGNMEAILNDALHMADYYEITNFYNLDDDGKFLYQDVKKKLDELYDEYIKDKATKVRVNQIYYESFSQGDYFYFDGNEVVEQVPMYYCDVVIETSEAPIVMNLCYLTTKSYRLYDISVPEDYATRMAIGVEASGDYDSQYVRGVDEINIWLQYYNDWVFDSELKDWALEKRMNSTDPLSDMSYRFIGQDFTRDCLTYDEKDELGNTIYGNSVAEKLRDLHEQVTTLDFTIENKGYDKEVHKRKAILYWDFMDQNGTGVHLTQYMYYGPYGYEAQKAAQDIYVSGELDDSLRKQLNDLF